MTTKISGCKHFTSWFLWIGGVWADLAEPLASQAPIKVLNKAIVITSFPGGSDGKEFAYDAGDSGSIL